MFKKLLILSIFLFTGSLKRNNIALASVQSVQQSNQLKIAVSENQVVFGFIKKTVRKVIGLVLRIIRKIKRIFTRKGRRRKVEKLADFFYIIYQKVYVYVCVIVW